MSSSAAARLHADPPASGHPLALEESTNLCRRVSCYARRRLRGHPHLPCTDSLIRDTAHSQSAREVCPGHPLASLRAATVRGGVPLGRFATEAELLALRYYLMMVRGGGWGPASATFSERPGDPRPSGATERS
jgi:hypothetical protein